MGVQSSLLHDVAWEDVEVLNQFLCASKSFQIGRTSDGYTAAKSAWTEGRNRVSTIQEEADLCRECHRLAPLLFLNDNTFVAVARNALAPQLVHLPLVRQAAARGAIGHYIAGTIRLDELNAALALS